MAIRYGVIAYRLSIATRHAYQDPLGRRYSHHVATDDVRQRGLEAPIAVPALQGLPGDIYGPEKEGSTVA